MFRYPVYFVKSHIYSKMQTWKETIALYRLLDEDDVSEDRADTATLATDA
jgi:hypothetical protein